MDNGIGIIPIAVFAACSVAFGLGLYLGTADIQQEKQFNEDREVFTFIRTWCDQKLANDRNSYEK